MLLRSIIVGVVAWLALPLQAALEFESTRVELAAKGGEPTLEAAFRFKNTGEKSVRVLDVVSTCGCTVPELEKRDYAAGESGEVKAVFTVGDRQGLQTKIVTVRTDAGDHALQLVANLPTRLEIAPRLVVFRGDDVAERTVKLTFGVDTPIKRLSLAGQGEAFDVTTVEEKPGERYTLTVKLKGTAKNDQRATLVVRSEGASGIEHTDTLFLRYIP